MKDYLKKYPILFALPLVLLPIVFFFLTREPDDEISDPALFPTESSASLDTSESKDQEWYVDVKGAVKKAGMYRIKEGMRLMNVIDLAGGFMEEADQNQLNFSKLVMDQEIIYVPKVREEIPTIKEEPSEGGSGTPEAETAKVNINTADATGLQQLSEIGEKKAADIIKYREENAVFARSKT